MTEKNLKKILDRLQTRYEKVSETDKQKIEELEKELKYKAPHFHFSDIVFPKVMGDMQVKNFPENQKINGEVEIKNLPKVQEVKGKIVAEISNFPKTKDIQKVEITNLPEQKEIEKPSWLDKVVDSLLTKLAALLATVAAKTVEMMIRSELTVRFDNPQPVIVVDHRGKALDMTPQVRSTNVVMGGGSSAGTSAISDPVAGYKVADTDETGVIKYYGFINKSGNWYIMANDTSVNTFRYSKGNSAYPTGWTGRATLTYDYFNIIFA